MVNAVRIVRPVQLRAQDQGKQSQPTSRANKIGGVSVLLLGLVVSAAIVYFGGDNSNHLTNNLSLAMLVITVAALLVGRVFRHHEKASDGDRRKQQENRPGWESGPSTVETSPGAAVETKVPSRLLARTRSSIHSLHVGQLFLLWCLSAAGEAVLFASFAIDLSTPNDASVLLGRFLVKLRGIDVAPVLKLVSDDGLSLFHLYAVVFLTNSETTRAVLLAIIPSGMFVITWIWFGHRTIDRKANTL